LLIKDINCFAVREAWGNKAAGIVSYGGAGGARAAEHLRGIFGELQIAGVKTHPILSLFTDFEGFRAFKLADLHVENINLMLEQVIAWSGSLKQLRK
jgi:NAD(P)H-dependent FMN reductase